MATVEAVQQLLSHNHHMYIPVDVLIYCQIVLDGEGEIANDFP